MTVLRTDAPVRAPDPVGRSSAHVVARLTARRMVRSGLLWGLVFGVFVAASALGYAAAYKSQAARDALARTLGSNAGVSALVGPAHDIQTVAGFTAWRSLGILSVVSAVWGLLAATRMLRGEEEAGRWEILLAGRTTRRRGTIQAITGLAAGVAALWIVAAASVVLVGRSSKVGIPAGAALFFSASLVASAAVFLAVGALASQLSPTRRQASAYGAVFLGAAYALRMVADSGTELEWLRWATPLGWVEELRPLSDPRPLAFLPVVALLAVLTGLTVHLAGLRDLNAGILADHDTAAPRTGLLGGPTGLAVRLLRPVALGWGTAIAAAGFIMGFIAKSGGGALTRSSSFKQVISRLGARGAGAGAYLGFAFLVVAALLALVAAGQVAVTRGEEGEGRLDNLLVRAVGRGSWFGGRVVVTAAFLAACGLIAGTFAWLGAATQSAGLGIASLVEAGLNLVPAALFVLGLGAFTHGVWPRAAAPVAYGFVAWSFLVELVGAVVNANHWLLDTSLFHQMAAAPAVAPDATSASVMAGLGLLLAVLGGLGLARRDLVAA